MNGITREELDRAYAEVRSEPPCQAVLEWRALCARREKRAETLIQYLETRTPRCPTCSGTGRSLLCAKGATKTDAPCPRCNGTGL